MEEKVEFTKLIFDLDKYKTYNKKIVLYHKQLQKLPKVQFCKLCIGSNQRPKTEFDKDEYAMHVDTPET